MEHRKAHIEILLNRRKQIMDGIFPTLIFSPSIRAHTALTAYLIGGQLLL